MMSDAFDPYEVLGVDRDAEAAEIKRAYREAILEWHPDLSPHPDAHERTVELNRAITIVGDPKLRVEYDRGPTAFMDEFRGWIAERMRVWRTRECLWCGAPLYEGEWTLPDGTTISGSFRRRDLLYCSNAHRQAAYRERKKRVARQLESRNAQELEP